MSECGLAVGNVVLLYLFLLWILLCDLRSPNFRPDLSRVLLFFFFNNASKNKIVVALKSLQRTHDNSFHCFIKNNTYLILSQAPKNLLWMQLGPELGLWLGLDSTH